MSERASMRAAVCHAFGQPLTIEDVVLDGPGEGEVQVELAACAICHSDIHYMDGAWGGDLPAVFGHEASGVVSGVGAGVTSASPGDHVVVTLIRSCGHCFYCTQGESHICETQFTLDRETRLRDAGGAALKQGLRTGAFAERVVVEQSQVVVIPKSVPLTSASLLACGVITGLGAVVNTARMPSGCSAVIVGAGGVGLNAVQGAVLAGAHTIVALDLADNKLEAARAFGATHAFNPSREDAGEGIRALTGGRGADYVYVTVGSVKAIEQAIGLVRRAGTVVLVGMPASGELAEIEALTVADGEIKIMGSKMGGARIRIDIPYLVTLYQQGRLKLDELVTGCYPLERINEAIESVRRSEALRNVIVFGESG